MVSRNSLLNCAIDGAAASISWFVDWRSTNAAMSAEGKAAVTASLERAKTFDQAGDETACMDEINKAQKAITQP